MLRLLIPLTFIQSFATVLLERGLYFYTEGKLEFSDTQNLALALCFGSMYTAGALLSHGITRKRGERPTLQAIFIGLMVLNFTIVLQPTMVVVWGGFAGIGFLEGMKWPIIETYVTAGATPRQTMRILGRFNVAWSSAVPAALIVSGPMMGSASPTSFILLAAVLHVGSLGAIRWLPWSPTHLDSNHPERPDPATTRRYRALLVSARWSMMGSCAMVFLLAPLMPTIFIDRLGHAVQTAPGLSSVMDVARVTAFVLLGVVVAWRGKVLPLGIGALGLPLGFMAILFAPTTVIAIGGQAVFGLCSGMVYYAAIYHSMVLHNASVEAGGKHESLIGAGFALGPLVGLAGVFLQRFTAEPRTAMLLAVSPCLLLCVLASWWPLLRLTWQTRRNRQALA